MASPEETRERILKTAWRLVGERGASAVTMSDVAAASGVSRQLLYLHFHNRAGLFVAMARDHDARSGIRRRVAASRQLPPVAGLEELLRLWCAYVPELLPVARGLEAAALTGDEGGAAWTDRMNDLHEAFRMAVERIHTDDRLAPGWTVEAATDWVWARSHLTTWRHLVEDRGWPLDDYTERSVRSIMAELVRR